jgi:hypothetical protein
MQESEQTPINNEEFLLFNMQNHYPQSPKSKFSILSQNRDFSNVKSNYFNFPHNSMRNESNFNLMQNHIPSLNVNSGLNNIQEIEEFTEFVLRNQERIEEECYKKMKGQFLKIITTQNGSRMLQKVLKKSNKEILSLILDEISEKIHELIIDPYANYFCQKFFAVLKSQDRIKFLQSISYHFIEISKSKIGTYPIQAFIEQLSSNEEKSLIIDCIKDYLLDLCYDSQGVHVIEKIIICFDEDLLQFAYELIINNFMNLANHSNGLCVIKKIIIHASKKETINKIMLRIVDNCLNLVQNPYGNYAIQVALDVIFVYLLYLELVRRKYFSYSQTLLKQIWKFVYAKVLK